MNVTRGKVEDCDAKFARVQMISFCRFQKFLVPRILPDQSKRNVVAVLIQVTNDGTTMPLIICSAEYANCGQRNSYNTQRIGNTRRARFADCNTWSERPGNYSDHPSMTRKNKRGIDCR